MEAKLYVGNLPYTTVDADLQTLFSQAGAVKSAQVIRDRASGRSKGFGFVEMSSEEEAQSAITMFHGKDFGGRPLTVNLARPREERPAGGGGGFADLAGERGAGVARDQPQCLYAGDRGVRRGREENAVEFGHVPDETITRGIPVLAQCIDEARTSNERGRPASLFR